ncbi:MAG: hypothetical protein RLZZ214_1110 [Verrucomicrobiota bacterium]|jgi:uncharacterized membrane protein YqiK
MSTTTLEPTEALILSGEGYFLEVLPSVIEQKSELLKFSALIVEVKDAVSSDAAGHQIKKLAAMRTLVEKSRTTVKAPVIATGKRIDALAGDFQAELTVEENRLKRLQGDYAVAVEQERQRVLAEMEKARQAEQERARLAEAAAAMAERERIAAEAAAFAATTPEEDAAAEAAAQAAEAAAAKRAAEEAARVAALPVAAPAFVPEAVKGVKMVADYEVEDIDALYRHNVGLVTLTERRKEILEAIARQTIGEALPTIPGLRVFLKPQVR